MRLDRARPPLLAAGLFVALAALFFGRALFGGGVLLPLDNLFLFPPWQAYAAQLGVTVPHNHLIADTILQNYGWKAFAARAYAGGQFPLWNPEILAGQPFLASAQNGSLYPPGLLFYLLPEGQAYAPFAALHLALAGGLTYWLTRVLGACRFGGLIAGVTFAFCGYLVVSVLWPMVVSTAVWLPGLLAVVELVMRRAAVVGGPGSDRGSQEESGSGGALLLLVLGGAGIVAMQFLAGHLEMSLYLLATTGLYAAGRLVGATRLVARGGPGRAGGPCGGDGIAPGEDGGPSGSPLRWRALSNGAQIGALRKPLVASLLLLAMVGLGSLGAAVQLVPFAEAIAANVRVGQVSYDDVRGYALPREQLGAFLVPDLFGNPSHHAVLDLFSGLRQAVDRPVGTVPDERWGTEWGPKNYVEGAAYLGLLPLLLAPIALLRRRDGPTWTLATIATISLLLTFGTPLYTLLFFGIPGASQLHTPFRWIYPYSLCVAVLAGLGASALTRAKGRESGGAEERGSEAVQAGGSRLRHSERSEESGRRLSRLNGARGAAAVARFFAALRMTGKRVALPTGPAYCAISVGTLGLVVLALVWVQREALLGLVERLVARSGPLNAAFPNARVFASYEWSNLVGASLLLLASGLVVLALARRARGARMLALGLLIGDLFSFGIGFNTVADPALLRFVPPEIEALRREAPDGPFRIATLGPDDTLPANTGMLFGLQDLRGYDTIILRDYVGFLELIEPQTGLLYSKIHKLFNPASLDSPLLDLLNVEFVLTTLPVERPDWRLVVEGAPGPSGAAVRVYRNGRALPRAFLVERAVAAIDAAESLRLLARPYFDPRQELILEAPPSAPAPPSVRQPGFGFEGAPGPPPSIAEYGGNRVLVEATVLRPAYLVLGDVNFAGWTVRVDGAEQPLLRADRIFRAVQLSPCRHQVVFEYRPFSFRVGGLLTLLAALLAALALGGWAYLRSGLTARAELGPVGRVLKNSLFPLATGLLNKGLDFGFALIYLRVLGPTGTGAYTFAVVVVGYFDILVNFGLGTLLTREVARDTEATGRYFGNTLAVRLALALLALSAALVLAGPLAQPLQLGPDVGLAIVLFTLGLLPGALAATASALFQARERMELPAAVTVLSTLARILLGTAALLAGWGVVGLALVSLAVNLLNAALLGGLMLNLFGRPAVRVEPAFCRGLLVQSWPLMLNSLLNSIFFRIDALLLQPLAGAAALGYYSTAYKFIDGLQIIPSTFVLALFPHLARQAAGQPAALARAFSLGLKVLLVLALPIVFGTTLLAEPIVLLLGGPAYLPDAARALQVLIWFLPFSFVNGLTQYVLIALNQQRWITVCFVIAAASNLTLNLWAIPRFGYLGAAAVTVISEWVLLVPFWYAVRRYLPPIPLLDLTWRPFVASAVMGLAVYWARDFNPWLAIPLGAAVYAFGLFALGTLTRDEMRALRRP
jgi:O-antigen/teichoic acid export membrane protein